MADAKKTQNSPGLGVDSKGNPVVDPTANVIALTEAANKRQDDLREAHEKYMEAEIRHTKELDAVKVTHVEQMATLREAHAEKINTLESNRLNAIRQVDVLAVKTEADRAQTAIQALAAQTAINADTLRNALNTTATTIAAQTSATVAGIVERIAALEKSSYIGTGRQALADPQIQELMEEIKMLRSSQSKGSGKDEGLALAKTQAARITALMITSVISLIGLAVTIVLFLAKKG